MSIGSDIREKGRKKAEGFSWKSGPGIFDRKNNNSITNSKRKENNLGAPTLCHSGAVFYTAFNLFLRQPQEAEDQKSKVVCSGSGN